MEKNVINVAESTYYLQKEPPYRKNELIVEYDIKSAGFNVLKYLKILPEKTLNEWEKLDKHTRTVKEGLLQKKYPDIAEKIINTLAEVRKEFVLVNGLESRDILTIKKDAIFVINKRPKNLIIQDLFQFRKKGQYTSFLYANKCEFYYNSIADSLDVKGISDRMREMQKNYLLNDIRQIMKTSEKVQPEQIYLMLRQYRNDYIERKLPLETYRDLFTEKFRIGNYTLNNISEDEREKIDISQNYMNIILPIIQTLL